MVERALAGRGDDSRSLVASVSMAERRCPRLFAVASAPESVGTRAVEVLASLGVALAPATVRVALNELARDIGIAEGAGGGAEGADGAGGLRTVLAAAHLPGAVAWRFPAVAVTFGALLESIAGAGVSVSPIVAWDDPATVSASVVGAARASALAQWEVSLLGLLRGMAQRECLILPPGAGSDMQAVLSRYVARLLAATESIQRHQWAEVQPGESGRATAAGQPHQGDGCLGPQSVLASQRQIAQLLRDLEGPHAPLAPLELPAPSEWAAALIDADRRARAAAEDAIDAWSRARVPARSGFAQQAGASWDAIARVSSRVLQRRPATRRGPY